MRHQTQAISSDTRLKGPHALTLYPRRQKHYSRQFRNLATIWLTTKINERWSENELILRKRVRFSHTSTHPNVIPIPNSKKSAEALRLKKKYILSTQIQGRQRNKLQERGWYKRRASSRWLWREMHIADASMSHDLQYQDAWRGLIDARYFLYKTDLKDNKDTYEQSTYLAWLTLTTSVVGLWLLLASLNRLHPRPRCETPTSCLLAWELIFWLGWE